MDSTTFAQRIQMLNRFPEAITQYALGVGNRLDDAGRADLCAKLEAEYTDFVGLEDARLTQQSKMLEELVAFKNEHMPVLQRGIEDNEHKTADNLIK